MSEIAMFREMADSQVPVTQDVDCKSDSAHNFVRDNRSPAWVPDTGSEYEN